MVWNSKKKPCGRNLRVHYQENHLLGDRNKKVQHKKGSFTRAHKKDSLGPISAFL